MSCSNFGCRATRIPFINSQRQPPAAHHGSQAVSAPWLAAREGDESCSQRWTGSRLRSTGRRSTGQRSQGRRSTGQRASVIGKRTAEPSADSVAQQSAQLAQDTCNGSAPASSASSGTNAGEPTFSVAIGRGQRSARRSTGDEQGNGNRRFNFSPQRAGDGSRRRRLVLSGASWMQHGLATAARR